MASSLPIIRPPSPPEDELQLAADSNEISYAFSNSNTLSPTTAVFPRVKRASVAGILAPPDTAFSPSNASSFSGNSSPAIGNDYHSSESDSSPFNFQTQTYTIGNPPKLKQVPAPLTILHGTASYERLQENFGRRRGHKYARSSVSHQIILSPTPRTPLQLPTSLPIPTFKEFRTSMTTEQSLRFCWCVCHLLVAAWVQARGSHGSLAMTALSHLLFFDALGAFLVVAVDVSRNFEVWNRSSVRTPFGLERAEVMAGLAMAIILLFMGLDLISHGLQHALENRSGHEAHHAHGHERIGAGDVDFAAAASAATTLVSAGVLGNHGRIGRTMRVPFLGWLPRGFRSPSHLLTMSCSGLLLILPLLDLHTYEWIDPTLGLVMALAMVFLGSGLAYTLGRMLLMSYSDPGIKDVIYELENDSMVSTVEEAKIWQVHYGLCMANFKLRIRDIGQSEKLRERVVSLVRNRLGGGYGEGSKGVKWEVSTEIILDRD